MLAATAFISIFAAQLALGIAVVVYVARLVRRETRLARLPVDGPLLAFVVWTLLSASFSPEPLASHRSAKQLVLFTALYLAADAFSSDEARERVMTAMLVGGFCLGAGAVLQFHWLHFDTLDRRPHSFLGHYMTTSGLAMSTLVLSAARLAFAPLALPGSRDLRALAVLCVSLAGWAMTQAIDAVAVLSLRIFIAGVVAAVLAMTLTRGSWPGPGARTLIATAAFVVSAWTLAVSRTRNAWLGALVGLALVLFLRAPKALWLLPPAIAAVLLVPTVRDRLTVLDASSRDRFYMWQAGFDMIRDKPVFGQGPGMILEVYPRYRWEEAPNPRAPHLHDNALQIAAERGLPSVVLWLWWVAAAMGDGWREFRRSAPGNAWVAVASLACLSAMMAGGLFEYNFGDSEVLMFTMLAAGLPYALRRQRELSA